jgi:hypothetical protein
MADDDDDRGGIRSWLKRPVVWLGGIVVAALGVALTNALVPWFTSLIDRATERGSPVEVVDAQPYQSDEAGASVAFPADVELGDDALAEVNAMEDRFTHLLARGGSPVGAAFTRILLEGARSDTVRIVDAGIERDCGEPLDGSLFLDPPAGADDSIRLDFDLDEADPEATRRGDDGQPAQFFPAQTISLAEGEQVPLVVTASTQEQSCAFRVRFTVLSGGDETTVVVPDAAEPPFRVTASLPETEYDAVFLGGVACGAGEFVRASEEYFTTGVEPACQ